MIDPEKVALALTVLIAVVAHPRPAAAQAVEAAHDDAEWENDRQPPYDGDGWLASQGGTPGVAPRRTTWP